MVKVLYANSVEASHTREVFLLIFRFVSPDKKEEAVYITISPSGAVSLKDILEKELEDYVKQFGNIVVGDWLMEKKDKNGNATTYLS